tara:strand:- start:69094 stop:69564 length:471 start_codon:yes stop_codon:yes gene_type:complete
MSDEETKDIGLFGMVEKPPEEVEEITRKKIGLFDFVKSISSEKNYLYGDDTAKEYIPFMINKALSQHVDTIMFANEMNKSPFISKEMQHDFLFYSISPSNRFGKWAKQEPVDKEIIGYLKDKYKLGNERALEYYDLLPDEQIKIIRNKLKTLRGKK